mmetsp:Transcript_23600/g.26177  ORF Transcript_23600/g.26177 Transcript_23600/m.26177 type:complete len:220 (+) Transcript_23600:232-891(+)
MAATSVSVTLSPATLISALVVSCLFVVAWSILMIISSRSMLGNFNLNQTLILLMRSASAKTPLKIIFHFGAGHNLVVSISTHLSQIHQRGFLVNSNSTLKKQAGYCLERPLSKILGRFELSIMASTRVLWAEFTANSTLSFGVSEPRQATPILVFNFLTHSTIGIGESAGSGHTSGLSHVSPGIHPTLGQKLQVLDEKQVLHSSSSKFLEQATPCPGSH